MALKTSNYRFHPLGDIPDNTYQFSKTYFSNKEKILFSNDYFFVKGKKITKIAAETASSAVKKFADAPPDLIMSKASAKDNKVFTPEVLNLLKINS